MRKRWIGPPNPGADGEEQGHEVTIAGRDFGLVKPGDVIDVPDELVAATEDWPGVVFPGELWEDAGQRKQIKKDGDA